MGTETIMKHKCNIPDLKFHHSDSTGAGSQLQLTQLIPKKVPTNEIDKLNSVVVTGLAKDLRPLSTVESEEFRHIAQAMITFGAKFGNQKFENVIHCRRTLKEKHLPNLAGSERCNLKNMLAQSQSFPYFSFTFDLWTESKKQRHFLSLTCHFVDHDFSVQSKLMGAHEFPVDLRKTTLNIREECSKILSIYFKEQEVPSILTQSVAVTDGGSNVTGVFSSRLPCMCHKLNLILDNAFSDKNMEDYSEIKGALNVVKSLVTFFKHSGLNSKLICTLKQSVPTRWNSQVTMLESYKSSAAEVQQILVEKKQLNRLVGLNEDLISELIEVLKPFKAISEFFSSEKIVTIDKIVIKHHHLEKHLAEKQEDSLPIRRLKIKMRDLFKRYYILDTVHFAALALNPRFKSLKLATEEQRSKAYDFIRKRIDLFADTSCDVELEPAPVKKSKLDFSDEDLQDSDEDCSDESSLDELTSYLQSRLKKNSNDERDLLEYWRDAKQYPKLRKVAFWILGIPASSAADERTFSATGQIISDRRCLLGGSTVSDLTLIHKIFKY